jgi:ring-1,2-phenylacetyl-CoA epoxidase subunit PaaD
MVTPEQRTIAAADESGPSPALSAIWHALDTVPDPEIPVVSVVELGIVRSVEWDATDPAMLVVRVTPTYSGCPATDVIMANIRETLAALGIVRLRLETQLSPAWTTEWIAPAARRKLGEYGIAPPGGAPSAVAGAARRIDITGLSPLRRSSVVVPCPRCASPRTRLLSQFGSTACKAQYRCDDCLEPFDYFKPH